MKSPRTSLHLSSPPIGRLTSHAFHFSRRSSKEGLKIRAFIEPPFPLSFLAFSSMRCIGNRSYDFGEFVFSSGVYWNRERKLCESLISEAWRMMRRVEVCRFSFSRIAFRVAIFFFFLKLLNVVVRELSLTFIFEDNRIAIFLKRLINLYRYV